MDKLKKYKVNFKDLSKKAQKKWIYPNPFTPEILGYFKSDKKEIELSRGFALNGDDMFGVTIIGDTYNSRVKWSLDEAKDYILDYLTGCNDVWWINIFECIKMVENYHYFKTCNNFNNFFKR